MSSKTKTAMTKIDELTLEVLERGRNLLGFHGEWVSATSEDGTTYSLSGGQGLGNMWLQFAAKDTDGNCFDVCMDLTPIMHRLCEMADARFAKAQPSTDQHT